MEAPVDAVLDAATSVMSGSVTRTAASVIGKRGGETLIVATTRFSYTITIMLSVPVSFTVRPRGWLKRGLAVTGAPSEKVEQILDGPELARLTTLSPIRFELGTNSLQLEL